MSLNEAFAEALGISPLSRWTRYRAVRPRGQRGTNLEV
jgi:hypothetical protein